MSAARNRSGVADEHGAIDLLEEAAHLLRMLPIATHAAYLVGTAPFVLGGLYFVADMSRGAFAMRHVSEAALGMTLLFAWMKAWHAVAAGRALAFLEQREPARVGVWKMLRLAARQFRFHAFGLALLPLALVLTLPFGWVYAYYQSATVLGFSSDGQLHTACVTQARLWPKQNHLMLALVSLLALFVFLDMAVAIYFVPTLLRSLLGIESFSANAGWTPLNTTFLTAAAGLTFLAVDPLVKCAYVLRCFRGQAQHSGIDLLVRARESLARIATGSVLAAVLFLALATSARAGETLVENDQAPAAPAPVAIGTEPRVVDARELNTALDRVLDRPEFSWRLPRESLAESEGEDGVIARFADSVLGAIRSVARWTSRVISKLIDWILHRGSDGDVPGGHAGSFAGLASVLQVILIVLVGFLVLALLWLAWRWWARSRADNTPAAAPVVTPLHERDDITADQLPEDEWIRLARESLARGDVRLALRALFLGSLAALGARGLLVLAPHKSNRDYERELARRGAQLAGISSAFAENRRVFERAWYGHEPAGADDVKRFEETVRRIREGAA